MKAHYLYLLLGCIVMFSSLQAQTYSTPQSAYTHLYEVNQEWQHYPKACENAQIHFKSEEARIQFHLESVIAYLEQNVADGFTAIAQKKRYQLLDELKLYAARQVFPKNIYHQERRPYFIDHQGTHCAVGYLMKVSGAGDLAQQISQEHNYDYIADITTDGVEVWAMEHGFSVNELAWIQPGYPSETHYETFGGGTNGTVRKIVDLNPSLYVIGDFTEVNNMPCLSIGVYANNQLSCLGTGLNGTVNDVSEHGNINKIYAIGDLTHNGQQYAMAVYESATGWTYSNIPNRSGAKGIALLPTFNKQEVVLEYNGNHEVWEHDVTNDTWTKKATTVGVIHDLTFYATGICYVGDFDAITHHTGGSSQTYTSHNAIIYDYISNAFVDNTISATDADKVSDIIYTVEVQGAVLYFGGKCSLHGIALSRYFNNSVEALIRTADPTGLAPWSSITHSVQNIDDPQNNSIYDIEYNPSSGELLIATNMEHTPFVGLYSSGVFRYNATSALVSADGDFDEPVRSIWFNAANNTVVAGGEFSNCTGDSVAYIGELVVLSSIDPIPALKELATVVYPNPTDGNATIELDATEEQVTVRVLNALGQEMLKQTYESVNSIPLNLAGKEAGMYLVDVQTLERRSVTKLIKQ